MPAHKAEPAKSKSKSSPSRVKGGKVTGNGSSSGGEGKRMSSLSSFQATLNFSALPTASSSSATTRPSSSRSWSSSTQGKGKATIAAETKPSIGDKDTKLMPPPPLSLQTKSRLAVDGSATVTGGENKSKGKGKAVQVIEVDSDDDGEEEGQLDRAGLSSRITDGMWADAYPPRTEADLVPTKKRIEKVKEWMQAALYGFSSDVPAYLRANTAAADRIKKYKRILLLSGPAGAGKTTTVRVLAKDMGVDLIEWGEAADDSGGGFGGMDRESAITKFTTFLSRNTYSPLALSTTSNISASSSSASSSSISATHHRPRLLFLTSLPNISHGPTREAFHAALKEFCSVYTSSSCPMIIIHSEAGSSGVAEESWRERERGGREGAFQILGKEVKDGPFCQEVEFLPVAPTFMIKALKKVLENASASAGHHFPLPTVASVQLLALNSNGDLRSAVNSLQLLCTQVRIAVDGGKKRKIVSQEEFETGKKRRMVGGNGSGRGSRGGKGSRIELPDDLRAVLDALTRKEQSLHLFHALGKVLYNKRLDDPPLDTDDQGLIDQIRALPRDDPLPRHLREFQRRKSLVQMEAFAGSIPLDASTFALWLHQSLPAFCSTIDQASSAIDELCAADIMRTDDDIWQSSTQAISYALQLSIRGAQLSLPSPVPRNHQKILKPQFFPSLKDEKKNLELLDTAAAYLTKRAVAASLPLAEIDMNADTAVGAEGSKGSMGYPSAPFGGFVSRLTLASEMVPMLVKMQDLTRRPLLPATVAPLRMPPFGHLGTSGGEELTASQMDMEVEGDGDGLEGGEGEGETGVLSIGWDTEEVEKSQVEEKGWLEDDDIIDWD